VQIGVDGLPAPCSTREVLRARHSVRARGRYAVLPCGGGIYRLRLRWLLSDHRRVRHCEGNQGVDWRTILAGLAEAVPLPYVHRDGAEDVAVQLLIVGVAKRSRRDCFL
jgi:hypothetical protein